MWSSEYTNYFLMYIIIYLLTKAIYFIAGDKEKDKEEK